MERLLGLFDTNKKKSYKYIKSRYKKENKSGVVLKAPVKFGKKIFVIYSKTNYAMNVVCNGVEKKDSRWVIDAVEYEIRDFIVDSIVFSENETYNVIAKNESLTVTLSSRDLKRAWFLNEDEAFIALQALKERE